MTVDSKVTVWSLRIPVMRHRFKCINPRQYMYHPPGDASVVISSLRFAVTRTCKQIQAKDSAANSTFVAVRRQGIIGEERDISQIVGARCSRLFI